MRIIVDARGGDNAPLCNVRGALAAHRDFGVDSLITDFPGLASATLGNR